MFVIIIVGLCVSRPFFISLLSFLKKMYVSFLMLCRGVRGTLVNLFSAGPQLDAIKMWVLIYSCSTAPCGEGHTFIYERLTDGLDGLLIYL